MLCVAEHTSARLFSPMSNMEQRRHTRGRYFGTTEGAMWRIIWSGLDWKFPPLNERARNWLRGELGRPRPDWPVPLEHPEGIPTVQRQEHRFSDVV